MIGWIEETIGSVRTGSRWPEATEHAPMPVLQQNDDGSGYLLRDSDDEPATIHDLRPEGAQILLNVYGFKVGGAVDRETVEKLIGLRLASLRQVEVEVEIVEVEIEVVPEPPVVPPPPPPPAPKRVPATPVMSPPSPRPRRVPEPSIKSRSTSGPLSRASRDQERADPTVRPAWTKPTPVAEPRGYLVRNQRKTRGREVALQVLYQVEQNPGLPAAEIDQFLVRRLQEPKLCEFAAGLVAGVKEHREAIDAMITDVAENWRLDRMAAIDRNILRLGTYEMLFDASVPAKVAINEALELAKRYSTAQSSRFVNGILDRLLVADLARKAAEPPAEPTSTDGA